MEQESRVEKSLLNARVNLMCYFLSLVVAFFTRKVLLDQLGVEFIGLTGALSSVLGFLNLAELGVGSAIGYVLYKPIYDNDKYKINEVISLLGYLYKKIGLFILGAGVIISFFLPLIFADTGFSWGVIYLGFYCYLSSSLLGYFVNYRMSLLSADQRNYEVAWVFQISTTIKVLIQVVLALKYQSFVMYLCLEVLFGVVNSVALNYRINKVYPWLRTDVRLGKELFKKYPKVWVYIKQLFAHKVGYFAQFQLIPILIYPFASLAMVALYGNYTMLSSRIQALVGNVLDSTRAGVGNLISSGDQQKIYAVYKQLLSIRTLAAGLLSCCTFVLASGFIEVWLGEQYVLSDTILFMVCVSMFLGLLRGANDEFMFGYGLFYDVWAPLAEGAILVVVSLVGGFVWGFEGVLLGPIVSLIIIVHIWKPYFLFGKGFNKPMANYFGLVLKHLVPVLAAYFVAEIIMDKIDIVIVDWRSFIYVATVFTAILGVMSVVLSYAMSRDFRGFISRFIKR
ncbi:MAG: sugar transporter [Rikenellaceae bacterium]